MNSPSPAVVSLASPSARTALILFDGVCNFCNASINFIIDHDPAQRFQFASLQSDIGQELLAHFGRNQTDFDSVLLVENGQLYQKSDAALRIARQLHGLQWLSIARWVPRFLRDAVYTLIARNRYRLFGKRDACRIPTPQERERFLG